MEPINFQSLPEKMKIQLLHILLQFLRELNLVETCHEFERVHGLYFDMSYFKELISRGSWDELEHYLRGFTTYQSNDISKELFYEISKQKYFEALQRGEAEHAKYILETDISTIRGSQDPSVIELSSVRYPENFRTNHLGVIDVRKWRELLLEKLPPLVESNPELKDKLTLPQIDGRLITLARQSLEEQYSKCQCPIDPWSLLKDHQCSDQDSPSQQVDRTPVANRVRSTRTTGRRASGGM